MIPYPGPALEQLRITYRAVQFREQLNTEIKDPGKTSRNKETRENNTHAKGDDVDGNNSTESLPGNQKQKEENHQIRHKWVISPGFLYVTS